MPDGVRGGGRPGGGMPGGGRPGGGRPGGGRPGGGFPRFPERERRFPRFFFFPIYYGQPYPRCDYIDRYGRCCDIYGRCCDSYGRCDYDYYSGGYPLVGSVDTDEGMYGGGTDMTQDLSRGDYDRNY